MNGLPGNPVTGGGRFYNACGAVGLGRDSYTPTKTGYYFHTGKQVIYQCCLN